ncbi:hypothetical protein N802_12855 [Knoellia sinensis KCTC 19936]|uniref:Uncharacterized protein n=1 Tax=Knoellia sinensis KCTC 19936 TaxID=1385520 RepID=A0A0A0JFQ1_9MICO|nr:hypothetical protein [Knoellia sinensis]KGN34421.1 hypothetical protein N802_12855 [Knoellia sinensis KCTC 19936]
MEHPEPGRLREFVASVAWPDWQVTIAGPRVRFVSDEGQRREVVWDITEPELAARCRSLDDETRVAMGLGAHGYHLVQVHLEEALATFEGTHGRLALTTHGLEVSTT